MSDIESTSHKRFKRKGYARHEVKPAGQGKHAAKPNYYPPEMTNHDKMVWRKDRRERERAITKEGTNQP